jgi:hypothetical protein
VAAASADDHGDSRDILRQRAEQNSNLPSWMPEYPPETIPLVGPNGEDWGYVTGGDVTVTGETQTGARVIDSYELEDDESQGE